MSLPIVAIVGRPNVGKSTFFNKTVGRRISIVEDTPGVTRDRLYADAEWCGYNFTVIDTGGLAPESATAEQDEGAQMWRYIRRQAEIAVELADVIIFMVDGKAGLLSGDGEIADYLRKSGKPIVLAVNKLDNNQIEKTFEFYELGLGEPILLSAEQLKGIGDVLEEVVKHFSRDQAELAERVSIAVVGKPNAGKSSIVNALLGFERVIVSDIPGTTRDAIDTPFEYNGRSYNLIDTAGMRRKRSIDENVEKTSVLRAIYAIKRADIVLVVCDAEEGITEQFVRICGIADREGKPSVIVMNKWDAVEKDTFTINKFNAELAESLKFMSYFTPVYISAKTGQRVEKVMAYVENSMAEAGKRVATSTLNEIVGEAIASNPPANKRGKKLKLFYITQPALHPPTFIFTVSDKTLMNFAYERYLENSIRKAFEFKGTPIRMFFHERREGE